MLRRGKLLTNKLINETAKSIYQSHTLVSLMVDTTRLSVNIIFQWIACLFLSTINHLIIYRFVRIPDYDKERTAGVTRQQRILTPLWYLILPCRFYRGPWLLKFGLLIEYRIVDGFSSISGLNNLSKSQQFSQQWLLNRYDIGCVAGVTGRQIMLTPPRHFILPLSFKNSVFDWLIFQLFFWIIDFGVCLLSTQVIRKFWPFATYSKF